MIEVELKFQPTEEQYKSLLEGAEKCGQKINHDIYYDYPDFSFFKKGVRLRDRNGFFELKIKTTDGVHLEIEDEKEIEKYLGFDTSLRDSLKENFIVIMDYEVEREKYKKREFNIDIDKLNFGYDMCEIEIMVENENQVKEAKDKILRFAKEFDIENREILSKGAEYLRRFNSKMFEEIYQ